MKATTRNRRLLLLADFLHNLPRKFRKNFDMTLWRSGGKMGGCGTSACALGWSPEVPQLQRAGATVGALQSNAFGLGMKVFGVVGRDFDDLFLDTGDKLTPKQWAKRCRQWVKNHPSMAGEQSVQA